VRFNIIFTPFHPSLPPSSLNVDRKKVVWSQRVSPQQRDKKAIEERKRKVTEQEQDQKRHQGEGGREREGEGGREGGREG